MKIRKANHNDEIRIKKVHVATYKKTYKRYLPNDFLDAMIIYDDVI